MLEVTVKGFAEKGFKSGMEERVGDEK